MSSLALSVLLSLVSAVAYAAGAIIQERVAATDDNAWHALLRNAVWWVAVVLNGVGAVLHVVALAYGPLSLVQPLGALTIVFALPMAALFVGRRAGATAWRGALMATAGLGGLLALTGNAEPHTLNGPEQVLLAAVTFGAVGALVVLSRTLRRPVLRSIVLATGAGAAFGMASVFTKTVAVEWTSGSVRSGALPLLVIAGLAAAGLFLSQAAYRGAGLTAPLATVTVVNPVVAAAIGLTLFGEHFRLGVPGTVLALSCGALAAAGLIMLTRERMNREHAEEALADPEPAGPGARRAAPARVDGARGAEGQEDGQSSSSPDVSDAPAVPGPAPAATKSSPLPPGRAVPQVEFGTPGPLAEQQRRGGSTLRRPRSERRVQTLTPPARR
ncbi:DMT family transporter [Streptomyces sp. MBT67]|uniref:DMT family transporter n=1 Tax=unclassified Streptomyces TaxID=2593676 RepID=UPI00190E2622|nr:MULTISPECIES: DMT family transporter [unclassified Streptomyces]MBK3529360.1 DMT family transporter [Streptomyces sp. MBT72]MBK3535830.1 DMT family transporter [Streptomyces sp. MBT67]MBK3549821.1 DMT family transporter [Streptomyces sp. MBT61]MBK6028430.1 DMT family transporter [Streptomyces sp. MBT59]